MPLYSATPQDASEDAIEDLAEGLDVLLILERAYERALKAHVIAPSAQASTPSLPASSRPRRIVHFLHPLFYAPLFIVCPNTVSSLFQVEERPSKQEHARLEVENAEDDLVQKTEVAITLMKAVLDNVRNGFWRNLLFFPVNLSFCLHSPNPLRTLMSSSKLR